jgi:Protein of unknown function (DUF3800)
MDYFIDECGHTGDLAKGSTIPDFGSQPIFTLAAIGIADSSSLELEIDRLKTKHGIKLSELKSSGMRDRPSFTLDLVRFICDERYPFFLEIMDKKYFIAANITSIQLLPPIRGLAEDARANFIKNTIADYILEQAPDDVFATFIDACKAPSDATLRTQMEALIEFAHSAASADGPQFAIGELATTALNEYREACGQGRENAFLRYLPIPDDNKYNKPVWMLPNLSAFTNIYARVNLFQKGRLSNVRLVHDEQLQFDSILEKSKAAAESLQHAAVEVFTPHSDFHFRETASLSFENSTTSTGLQVADIVAGFCMRYVKEFFTDRNSVPIAAHQTYDLLRRYTDERNGVGVNLVTSYRWHRELSLFVAQRGSPAPPLE